MRDLLNQIGKLMRKCKILSALLFMVWLQPASAATLLIEDGQLTGATDLLAGDALVDVSFVDGTCSEVFSGCAQPSDFPSVDVELARAIQTAIGDTVLIDGALGAFDSNALLTRGCDGGDRGLNFVCGLSLPVVETSVVGVDFVPGSSLRNINSGRSGIDKQISFGALFQGNTIGSTWVVVSNVRTDLTPVPLLASLPLALSALFGFAVLGRFKAA